MDFKTAAGAIPAERPSAMLDISNARNACSLTTRIRNSSSAIEATVRRRRDMWNRQSCLLSQATAQAGMPILQLPRSDLGFEPDQKHQHKNHTCACQRKRHHDAYAPDVGKVSQGPGRQHSAGECDGENAVEKTRL